MCITAVICIVIPVPTPPGEFVIVRSTNSLNISWARPLNMSSVSHYFQLTYSNIVLNCSQNYCSLEGLSAGVQYNISVRTVGAMGYFSSPRYCPTYTSKQCTFVFFCFDWRRGGGGWHVLPTWPSAPTINAHL